MIRATLVCALLVLAAPAAARAQAPARSEGWVVIPVDEYRSLRLRAYPPDRPPDPPPVEATISRVEYELRAAAQPAVSGAVAGEARLMVDVLKEGWVRIDIPPGLLVRTARVDGRQVALIDKPAPHVLLSRPGRFVLSLEVVLPVKANGAAQTVLVPASPGAVSRVAIVVPREGVDVSVSGGVLVDRPQQPDGRWVAYGRGGQAMTISWERRTPVVRSTQELKWRGHVTQIVGLGEETNPVSATLQVEVTQGAASSIELATGDGLIVNQVAGATVADWEFAPGVLRVKFLDALTGQTSFLISGETRAPREGAVAIPLVRLPAAERETGGIAVEVLGAGEIRERQPTGLDPADPSDLGDLVRGRESPSMVAFRYRVQDDRAPRSLTVSVARYTPQAVLIANVEEARYDALVGEEGKTLVRARYAVRNNQRAFLAITLPAGASLWSASLGGRPVRPGVSPAGGLLLPLEKGRAGADAPVFAVELTYVQRTAAWEDKGKTSLTLPALDLPTSRTGVVLHYSPRFRVTPEPGTFSVDIDPGPLTEALRLEDSVTAAAPPPPPPAAPAQDLVAQYRQDTAGRAVTGPLPVRIPFPQIGPSVFLTAALTAEAQSPSLEFSYKRENRW
ncbi:MAG TPA: hypothetical protein VG106_00155 [Vicinamibacterales bacterium]|nr:hypothetical protein [Vicinamibacterales bacterium]